jgi:hypothetical protein
MRATTFTLTTFTPSQVEAITTLSTTLQRDWRRRGFLPYGDGHARFDAMDVAELWVMKLLADRGIGPQQGRDCAPWPAYGIVARALTDARAYEGAVSAAALDGAAPDMTLEDRLPVLARRVLKQIDRPSGASRFRLGRFCLIIGSGGQHWVDSLDDYFDDARRAHVEPIVILDQYALGDALVERALDVGRPLVTVDVHMPERA